MTTLLIMLAGVGTGRFFPAGQKAKNELLQLFCTLLLIFSMGASLGQRQGFFSELAVLGTQSFLFFLIPAAFSIAAVYFLTSRLMGRRAETTAEISRRTDRRMDGETNAENGREMGRRMDGETDRQTGREKRKGDPMMFLALGALLSGMGCGAVPAAALFLEPLISRAQWILWLLMFSVGISVGLHKGILNKIRESHIKIFVIPFGIIAGSLMGGALCGLLLRYPVNEAVSIAGGLGWYSLAGVSISSLAGARIGSIAFLSNLLREISSFFMIPWIARHLNAYTCIAPAAATSEDTTLPMLIRYTNEETVVLAVLNGIICSAFVPVLLSFCYSF